MTRSINLAYLRGCRPFEPESMPSKSAHLDVDITTTGITQNKRIMFGFQGGDSSDMVARKKRYMDEAQQLWPFLNFFDLSTIRNDVQLSLIIEDRSGVPSAQARSEVESWMNGKQF